MHGKVLDRRTWKMVENTPVSVFNGAQTKSQRQSRQEQLTRQHKARPVALTFSYLLSDPARDPE